MSDELKPQATVDTPEFRTLLIAYAETNDSHVPMEEWRVARDALIAHIDVWGARLAADAAKDAERYRWLRDKARHEWDERLFVTDDGHKDYYAANGICESELDAAIDKAIAAAPTPKEDA